MEEAVFSFKCKSSSKRKHGEKEQSKDTKHNPFHLMTFKEARTSTHTPHCSIKMHIRKVVTHGPGELEDMTVVLGEHDKLTWLSVIMAANPQTHKANACLTSSRYTSFLTPNEIDFKFRWAYGGACGLFTAPQFDLKTSNN